jgi:UDP-glucose 4-epimerase
VPGAVLITGGNGFLGAHIAPRLAQEGYQVCSYDIAQPLPEALFLRRDLPAAITDITGSVTDVDELTRVMHAHQISHVVHTAAASDPVRSVEQPYETYALNAMGTAAVLEAACHAGVARVVTISSNAVYDVNVYEPVDERHPTINIAHGNQLAHYGASKMISEIMALTYGTWNGVDALVLRLSAVYGFGMRGSLYIRPMVEQALASAPLRFTTGGDMPRDYTYVADVASAVLASLEVDTSSLAQRVFNISGGRAYKASELPELIRQVIPGADIEIGAGLAPNEVRDAPTRATLDLTASRNGLGFAPMWSLLRGVEDYVRMLRLFQASANP